MIFLGIALPALLLAAAVRRWVTPVEWRYVFLFLALTFAFLHGAVFTSRLPVPVDEVARGYPYRGVVGEVQPRNALTNDTVKLFLPWMQVAREELFHLRAPLWNRYSFAGYPLLANGESAPFSPLFLCTLFVPLPGQIVAMAGLKIFIALLFGFLFARRAGIGEAAACFAASAFAFSVFQAVFLYYSTTAVTAFLPAALYVVLEAQERARYRDGVLVALVVGTLMANGHPESVLHIAIGVIGLLLIDLALSTDRRAWAKRSIVPVTGALAGLGLSAPAWVPVLEQVLLSTRLADLRRASGPVVSYPLTAAWAMLSPNGFGNPVRQNWSWVLNYSLVAASYAGLLVLALFCAALLSRQTRARHRLWGVFAIALWLIAMGWSPLGRAFQSLPPFSITANDKLRFVAIFLAAVVGATVLDRLSRWYFLFAALSAAGALYVYALRKAWLRPADLVAPASVLILIVVILTARRHAPAAACLLLLCDLFTLNGSFNALVDGRYFRPRLPIIEELHRLAPHTPYRVAGLEWMFLPNASAQYGLEDVRGSDPMAYARYTNLLAPIVRDEPAIDFDRIVAVQHRLFDLLNVRYLLTEPGVDPGGRWRALYRGADGSLFENPSVLPRFYAREGDADVAIRQERPDRFRLTVQARTPVWIGSGQVAAPGWLVKAGGKRVNTELMEGALMSFRLPAGRSEVEVAYRPVSYWGSVVLSLAVILVGIGFGRVPLSRVPTREGSLENKP